MYKIFITLFLTCFFWGCNSENNSKHSNDNKNLRLLSLSKEKGLDFKERVLLIEKASLDYINAPVDSIFLALISEKSNLYFKINEKDSANYYDKYLLEKASSISNNYYSGKASFNIALSFKDEQLYDSAYYYFNLSKNYFFAIRDSSQIGRRLVSMGLIQQNQSDFFGSKETITEALKYLNRKKDKKYIASSYNALGTNHRKLFNFYEAINYFSKTIETADSKKDKLIGKNNLAATYIDSKQYNNAISLLKSIASDSLIIKNQIELPRVLDNLTYAKWLLGKSVKEGDFLTPMNIRKKNKDKRGLIASYTHLGEFYSTSDPSKAITYFDLVIQLSKTLKIPRAEKDALKFLMKLKPNNVSLRNRYVFLQDSLYAQELKVKTQFAKYKYDDQLKQESILRLEKENTEKELEASQQRNQKLIYLGGLLFITSILGLSLYGFRQRTKLLKQKSKAEKLEAIQETEAQLSRKLHDDHGGKINQAMLMLQRGTDKSDILDKLESVYNQIRSFSREINTVDTGPDFWNSLKVTLEYIKPVEVELVFDGGKELDWSLVSHQAKTIIFKVLQELVKNMSRHSKANQTVILFRDKKKELSIYYEDDGVGASKKSILRKNGLWNTEKRIQALGGSITFDSEEEKGFRAEIRIPK